MINQIQIITVLLVMASLLAGCSSGEEAKVANAEAVKMVNVETRTVQPQMFERYLRLVGTVKSRNDVQISAEVSGRVEKYYVDNGDKIAKGAPILKIDDRKLKRQQAQLQAQTEQAREQYERLKRVFEQDSIGSKMNLIDAKTTYEQRKSAMEAVEVDLHNTVVRAPFAAALDDRMIETGEMASPGMPLVRIIGSKNLKVVAGVPSRYADVIHKGDRARLWFDFQQADTLELPITYVGQSIDQDARTFKIEIKLPEQSKNYKVDMNANLKLRTFTQDSSVVISKEFVYQKDNGYVVYTVAKNDSGHTMANEQPVTLGPSYENNTVVEGGLTFGETLITVGSSFLQDSMRVKLVAVRNQEIVQ